ncbi:glycoside hydrolase family 1 protein [Tessaracoccus palaemonis]|uniref:Glycoside hydrolase family 1 protein n=1 Tax=Tessaracoccus palaemonis TaxID=2829499 RepID=A0ABX8SK23_9ACTN|nr:glycoside hydrolase family 1 protein [Tessaracoccus palaemonis]QXT63732.1 glycoside hydrolase family 1 protein [Tessaracoccus palaemonis]
MTTSFPEGFFWGVASAAHQVEGNNTNSDLWLLEHVPGTIFAEPSGDALDHYHRYAEDIALIASLGFDTYRFSLEWARIEPAPGEYSVAELDHYRRMLEQCHAHGLRPVVTFHHFSSPRWLLAAGGWEDPETPARFARYCAVAMEHLGDLIDMACTLNEPNLPYLLAELGITGEPPEARAEIPVWANAAAELGIDPARIAPFQFNATPTGFAIKVAAHRAATEAIKSVRPDLPVGWTLANTDVQAAPGGEAYAERVRAAVNVRFLEISRDDDFVGIQNYGRHVFGADGLLGAEPGMPVNSQGEEIYPAGLAAAVREAWDVAAVPVVVTENGLATDDDAQRVGFLEGALEGLAEAIRDGVDVRGYIAWTAFDNYEWIFGYAPKFGLIAVDRTTQRRTPKPSAHWLGEVARSNGAGIGALIGATR